jgi:hypothetical protein
MKIALSRRMFLSTASAFGLSTAVALGAGLPISIPDSVTDWFKVVGNGKFALGLALDMFKAYVEIQSEIQRTEFTEKALYSIEGKFQRVAESIKNVEYQISELKDAFLHGLQAALLAEQISSLQAKWGVYRVAMGGAEKLPDIRSSRGRDEAIERLKLLKTAVIILLEDIKVKSPYNPIIVTPVFSAYSLLKAINERLVEDAGIFTSKEKLRAQYNSELKVQFSEWRDALLKPDEPNSLEARRKQLNAALPPARTEIALFDKFSNTFQAELKSRKGWCGRPSASGASDGINAVRLASCLIARANDRQILDLIPEDASDLVPGMMSFVLVDTWVRLKSTRGCVSHSLPAEAEMFDVYLASASKAVDRSFDRLIWNEPHLVFKDRGSCQIQSLANVDHLRQIEEAQDFNTALPDSVKAFQDIVKRFNGLQAEAVLVASAWVFVTQKLQLDANGSPVFGVASYNREFDNVSYELPTLGW